MVYFVTFSLIGTNVNGTKWETGKSRTALPRGSCKGSDQNGAPGPRYALAWTRGIRYVPPSEIEKWKIKHFWNSNRAIWWMPFGSGNILPESCFKIKYWLHYHVSSSSHLSCFDAFSRTSRILAQLITNRETRKPRNPRTALVLYWSYLITYVIVCVWCVNKFDHFDLLNCNMLTSTGRKTCYSGQPCFLMLWLRMTNTFKLGSIPFK